MGERATSVVCKFSEEGLRFAFGEDSHNLPEASMYFVQTMYCSIMDRFVDCS